MKTANIPLGLTYDDVLLIPQKSQIVSRKLVNTKTKISRHIDLAIPFVSSNVDTVTESAMAITMAKLGGIGMIHRFMTIAEEAQQIIRVKRSEGFIMGNPFTVKPNQTVGEINVLLRENQVTSALVVDEKNHVLGLLSERDMWFLKDENQLARDLMTPASKLITADPKTTLDQARQIFRKYKVEKLPLVNKKNELMGLITSRTVLNQDIYPMATKDTKGRLRVGAAVGVIGDYLERTQELIKAGVDVIVADVAHIHSVHGLKALKELRKVCHNVDLIGGNIATPKAATDVIKTGVDALKIGIGPGGICITRMVAGAGVPQLTAIMECAKVAKKHNIPVIADGGTNYSGDMTKALAAGASTVMITGWLAGTDESPGNIIMRKGQKYKIHRGAASFTAVASRKIRGIGQASITKISDKKLDQEIEEIVPEGVESFIPYKGAAKDVIFQLVGAVKSGMSYCNAKNIKELWRNSEFIRITSAGFGESKQHNVEEM